MNDRLTIIEAKLIKREYKLLWSLWRQGLVVSPSRSMHRAVTLAEAGTILAACIVGMVVIVVVALVAW